MLLTALMIGLVGSVHCAGMCGPIVLALPSGGKRNVFLLNRLIYNIGRILTYALLGLFFGLIGQGLSIAGFQRSVSIISGILILLFVFFPGFGIFQIRLDHYTTRFIQTLKNRLRILFKRRTYSSQFAIGILNGFLPCGLVYLAIAGALTGGSIIKGASYMAVFGLGTLPMLMAIAFGGKIITFSLRKKLTTLIPAFMVVLGLLFILRGMNLGIPYISPMIQDHGIVDHSVICH